MGVLLKKKLHKCLKLKECEKRLLYIFIDFISKTSLYCVEEIPTEGELGSGCTFMPCKLAPLDGVVS